MQLSLLHIASLITVFQTLLLILFLLSRKNGGAHSNRLLAVYLFSFAVLIYSSFVMSTPLGRNRTHLILSTMSSQFIFLVGPIFYFYLKSFFERHFVLRKKDLVHSLPFIVFLIATALAIPFLRFRFLYNNIYPFINGAVCVHLFAYLYHSAKLINANGLELRRIFSSIKKPTFSWILYLYLGLVTVWIFKLIIFFGWNIAGITLWCQFMATTFFMTTFVFINPIVYIALKRPSLFSHKERYDTSSLCEDKKELYLQKLQQFMQTKKPHLQSSITLPEMARRLSIPRHHLSQVINESFNLNFNDLINKYRIDEALVMLQDGDHQNGTILEIAYEVGFNSKSTFNTAFKKHTGITPKEYKNNGNGRDHHLTPNPETI